MHACVHRHSGSVRCLQAALTIIIIIIILIIISAGSPDSLSAGSPDSLSPGSLLRSFPRARGQLPLAVSPPSSRITTTDHPLSLPLNHCMCRPASPTASPAACVAAWITIVTQGWVLLMPTTRQAKHKARKPKLRIIVMVNSCSTTVFIICCDYIYDNHHYGTASMMTATTVLHL